MMVRSFLLVLAMTSVSLGGTLLVPEDYSTIQAALDAAQPGDVVSVAPGTYAEQVSFRSDGVTLQSRSPQEATIDSGGSGHAVSCIGHTATIEGFTLTGNGSGARAGVFAGDSGNVTVRGNIITGNKEAGIVLEHHSTAWIEGNTITNNGYTSTSGWGIRCRSSSSATIVNNYISGHGLGIESNNGILLAIINNTFRGNVYGIMLSEGRSVVENNILAEGQYGVCFRTTAVPGWEAVLALSLTMDHNDLWQNSVADYYAQLDPPLVSKENVNLSSYPQSGPFSPSPGTGEKHADPMFEGDGACVQGGSPVIDAGQNAAIWGWVSTDLTGQPRIMSGAVDIGACESPGPAIGAMPWGFCGAGVGPAMALCLLCMTLIRRGYRGRSE